MTFPVVVERSNGEFTATVVGVPGLRVVGPTRDAALAGLRGELQLRVERGELLSLEVERAAVSSLAGRYADDPTLREICAEAYELRDSESVE